MLEKNFDNKKITKIILNSKKNKNYFYYNNIIINNCSYNSYAIFNKYENIYHETTKYKSTK